MSNIRKAISARLGWVAGNARPGAKAVMSKVSQMLDQLESQARDQKDLAKNNANKIADYVAKHGTQGEFDRFAAIVERLGLSAFKRPGAKAKFASKRTTAGQLRKDLKRQGFTNPSDWEWHGIAASDADSTPYWLHEDGSMEKITASRLGAKAEMGRWDGVEVVSDFTWRNKQTGATASSGGSLPYVRQADAANWEKVPHFSFYDSRTNQTIGQQYKTRQQAEAALRERKAQEERDRAKQDRLKTTPAARRSEAIWKEIDRLMSRGMTQMEAIDYLKSRGLRMASSRPGAKVTAGRAEDLYRKLSSGTITYANVNEWDRLVSEALRLPDFTPAGGDMSLHEIAEDLGTDILALKSRAARSGAKAKFADGVDSFLTIKGVRYRIADVRTDAQGNTIYRLHGTSKTAQPVQYDLVKFKEGRWVLWGAQGQEVARGKTEASRPGAKSTHAATDETEREDVKAGLKIMAKADPKVSEKIRTLIKEGKPQDQAVAIALDMKRRGEL